MKQAQMFRILLADDSAEWRAKVRSILKESPLWRVIGEAGDGLQAVQMTEELTPDIVLLDIGMPLLNGIEAARRIRQVSSRTKVIFLTQNHDPDVKVAALAAGAVQYVLKESAFSELLPAMVAAFGTISPTSPPRRKALAF